MRLLTIGVFWDVQDVLPENIQRIEVIRGPGGTIWGACFTSLAAINLDQNEPRIERI